MKIIKENVYNVILNVLLAKYQLIIVNNVPKINISIRNVKQF